MDLIAFRTSYKRLVIRDDRYTSTEDFKNWLSSNNVVVYYVLATPTNIEVEYQPLIDQLNELEKAMSKDGQTNISQVNNDLPFIISASALKEWSYRYCYSYGRSKLDNDIICFFISRDIKSFN